MIKNKSKKKKFVDVICDLLTGEGIEYVTEHKFHKDRKWRFDIAFLKHKIAVEYDGGTYIGGRHTQGVGFANDCEKINYAQLDGWVVYRFCTGHFDLDIILKALNKSK